MIVTLEIFVPFMTATLTNESVKRNHEICIECNYRIIYR